MKIADRVLASGRRHPEPVVQGGVPGVEADASRVGPLDPVRSAEGGIDHVALFCAELAVERVALSCEGVNVADGRSLGLRLPEHVGIDGQTQR